MNTPQSAESDSDGDVHNPFRNFQFLNYLKEEFTQSFRKKQELDGSDGHGPFTNRVYTFVTVPQYLESFMTYGFLQCLDHLLVIYTFLPLRCLVTVLRLIMRLTLQIFQFRINVDSIFISNSKQECFVYCHELRDLVKFSLLCICTYTLAIYDSSVAYHEIRTQSVVKIYILFNLLEVADRLLSSVCQDALDDLLYTVSKYRSSRMNATSSQCENSVFESDYFIWLRDLTLQYCFALICLFAHCFLLLCQMTTLNVAFNSQNKSLMTVFISNNFVELKGNVFRKLGKTNLFQIACADVRERFHYAIWFAIIVCRNMNETGWNLDDLQTILFDVGCIYFAEVTVDWIKHSFITKFNVIPSNVYEEYTVSIAYDLLLCRQGKNKSDYFDLLSRRMGLTPIPLSCLINAMLLQIFRKNTNSYIIIPSIITCLFAIKILANLALMSMAYSHVRAYIKAASTTDDNNVVSRKVSEITLKGGLDRDARVEEVNVGARKGQQFGFDQTQFMMSTTIEEEQFLPSALRHRRIQSDATPVDLNNLINSNNELDLSQRICYESLLDYPFTSEAPQPISPTSSVTGTGAAGDENSDNHQDKYALSLKSSSMSSEINSLNSVTRNESMLQFMNQLEYPCSSATPTYSIKNLSATTNLTSVPAFHDEHLINPEDSTQISSDNTSQDYSTLLCRQKNYGSVIRPRRFTIDLGVLSTLKRRMDSESDTCNSPPLTVPFASNVPDQTAVKCLLTRRRIRTLTDGSRYTTNPTLDPAIPILWEQSNETNVVSRLKREPVNRVKQPLSDIDRYSMIEGQIS